MYIGDIDIRSRLLAATMLLAATFFAACKGDDDAPSAVAPSARVQVMTVFAPGQLGDQGYADRVMKGVNMLKKSDSDADSVEVDFIASYDVETTCSKLADWAAGYTSSLDGAPYSRRLVLLTEPFMVKWLAAAKESLTATDEVLLLKADSADVEAAAVALGLEAGRVHGLNISAASAVEHFEQARMDFYDAIGEHEMQTHLLRLYKDDTVQHRDSISATIWRMSPDISNIPTMTVMEEEGELYSTNLQGTAFQTSYGLCGFYWSLASLFDTHIFAIIDLGAANSGAQFFLMGSNENMRVIMMMLDAESNTVQHRFAITRHFDRAIAAWTETWLRQPTATMPLMETHGGWDGYCTDDIDPWAFYATE